MRLAPNTLPAAIVSFVQEIQSNFVNCLANDEGMKGPWPCEDAGIRALVEFVFPKVERKFP